jgi:thioredoxin reductase
MPEGYELLPKSANKNVMIIGGGPAGMEAARIAALRGYSVSIYEAKSSLGGLLEFASNIKGSHENLADLKNYFIRQMELLGVDVITKTEVDVALIQDKAPDVVILATGGRRASLGLTPSAGTSVISINDVMTAGVGDRVTIVGANAQAVDVAQYLLAQNREVTLVFPDPLEALGKGQSSWVKTFTIPTLYAKGVRAWPNAGISSVGDGEVTITGEMGVDIQIACDTIVEAVDMIPNKQLLDGIAGMETYAIGDCDNPWNIQSAITAGNLVARHL